MKRNALNEVGKSLLSLANMIATVVFFRQFWEYQDYISLLSGIIILISLYTIGMLILGKVKE